MNKLNILPADIYMVVNKTIMNDNDRKILTMLYQPIIGSISINLYFSLWGDLDKTEIMSIEFTHHHLMSNMQLRLDEIVDARMKLEAVGLIKTYFKKGDINNYIYELYSPLSASFFFTHPFLSVLLYNYLGKKDYDNVLEYFKIPKIDVNKFEDITTHFSDIFNTKPSDTNDILKNELKQKTKKDLQIDIDIDFNLIKSSIPKGVLNKKAIDEDEKTLIKQLSFLYQIDTLHMINIIRGCFNEKGFIDKIKLRTACRNYYQFEHDNKLPGLIYRNQPDHLKTQNIDSSKRSKIIYIFETLSPYDFLRAKYNGGTPTKRDIKLIESLIVEQKLNPGVVNVLIDYIIKINGNNLNKNFVETIAGQWKRLNITKVEEAMRQAEKEHKKHKNKTNSNFINKSKEPIPDWFNKEIKDDNMSVDEENKLKDILKEFS